MQPIHPEQIIVNITPLGDCAALVNFGNTIDPAINQRVLSLHEALAGSGFKGFVELVPAYASLAVFYDAPKIAKHTNSSPYAFVKNHLLVLLSQNNISNEVVKSFTNIPVCYDAEFGFDLHYLAAYHQLTINEIIAMHTAIVYRVYMIGFMPGFAYMGSVDDRLATPRKAQPRLNVPAGSVGIAGSQTGFYPTDSPGGWQIIGKTPLLLFDTNRSTPCLLNAGDQVQFVSIDKNEFQQIHGH